MAAESSWERANKRKLQMVVADTDRPSPHKLTKGHSHSKAALQYKFKILLPNGIALELTVIDPKPKMPLDYFIGLVKDEYFGRWRRVASVKEKRHINWKGENLYFEDANSHVIKDEVNFETFEPNKFQILKLYDGSDDIVDTFENMWDLTPDTDLLRELPEDYTFETALADLIDNSLQAVWMNSKNERKFISVNIAKDRISIFDTGPGMDGSDENSIVKWGKMGASLNRASKAQGIGGKPPYLTPCFGMFGYGGPIASMHLGRSALVSSKTKVSKKVYTLKLEKEALMRCSDAELTWRTNGGIRVPSKDEIADSPHGSFTKVEILEPKLKRLDIKQLGCKLKDIYFPYIQCDEASSTGKTTRPIEFQVNGIDLAEVAGGEVAITNLHSCNGPNFVLQLHLSLRQASATTKSPGSRPSREANARLKFVYFPITEEGEGIQIIADKLKSEGFVAADNYDASSRVSIRRLGRLLPDARWAFFPFMDSSQRKGEKARLLKKLCSRVKCFIDTDAGFNPTPSKTDLALQNPFTIALKNFGDKTFMDKDVIVEIHRDGKLLLPLQLEKNYEDWLLNMHDHYDAEKDCAVDQPILLVSPNNKKSLGISSDVARVHKVIKRKGAMWKSGQRVKLLKGAYAGIHKNNLYATIEYFLIEGFQGDAVGEARIICRPLPVPDDKGCDLAVNDGNACLKICSSLSLPVDVIDSEKCVPVDNIVWNQQLEKHRQKSPCTIELLKEMQCQELEIDGALPIRANAGQVPPREIVAVVRPGCYISSSDLVQKYIVKNSSEMLMELKFKCEDNLEDVRNIYSARVAPSSVKGYHGFYIFGVGCKFPDLFKNAGEYTFSFCLIESSCKSCEEKVLVEGSSEVGKWGLLNPKNIPELCVRVGSFFPPLSVACYDIFGNRIQFKSKADLMVKLLYPRKSAPVCIDKWKANLSKDKLTLNIEDILVVSSKLDNIRPNYKATLEISSKDESVSVSIPCQVTPGSLKHVAAQSQNLESLLLPGSVIKLLKFEMFDMHHNHVKKGLEVEIGVDGFCIEDQLGSRRKVDEKGFIDLSGVLKVTAGYGKKVSVCVFLSDKVFCKQEFQTEKRELRVISGVPECSTVGSYLEDITFEIVDSEGYVDITIHDDEKSGQSHTLTIKSDLISTEDSIRYAFRKGRCTVPAISLPQNEGCFCFVASHSRYTELATTIKLSVVQAPILECNEIGPPCSDEKVFLPEDSSPFKHLPAVRAPMLEFNEIRTPSSDGKGFLAEGSSPLKHLPAVRAPMLEFNEIRTPSSDGKGFLTEGSTPFKHVGNQIVPIMKNVKDLECKVYKYGLNIGSHEETLKLLNDQKTEIEQVISGLQVSVEPQFLNDPYCLLTKEEILKRIEARDRFPASVFFGSSKEFPCHEPWTKFTKDVVGLVALIGTVRSSNLSRILAEYLGEDQMLALVCRSFEAALAVAKYEQNGTIDVKQSLHANAAALGKSIDGRFLVICLDGIRAYSGKFEGNDRQMRLALPRPTLPGGNVPAGFIGYAVNMVDLDEHFVHMRTNARHGLRETLFYRLFGKLQVYRTRKDMIEAYTCIHHGAVSLDGGILKENGIISLGCGNPRICFPVTRLQISKVSMETLKQIEEKKSELEKVVREIHKCKKALDKNLKKFKKSSDQLMDLYQTSA